MSEHTTTYRDPFLHSRVTVAKKRYASRIDAEEHAAWWEHDSGKTLDLRSYLCRICGAWHLGRNGKKSYWWDFISPEDYRLFIERKKLYWALWRYANGRPVSHSRRRRRGKVTGPGMAAVKGRCVEAFAMALAIAGGDHDMTPTREEYAQARDLVDNFIEDLWAGKYINEK